MKVSVFVATSGRAGMAKDMLESLRDTTKGFDVQVCAVIDQDLTAFRFAMDFGCVTDYSPERRGALVAWNKALQMTTGDILVPAGDDQIFHPDWLQFALEGHQEALQGYGVLGMNDCAYKPPQTATMFLFDRKYCKEVMGGIFAPPMYHYYCIDSEWNEKAKKHGAFYWEEKSKVEHLHSAHGKRPVDDTDRLKEDEWMEIDNQTFEERKAHGFPVTWESLI